MRGRARGRRTGGRFRPIAEMNVIPMNDVMLVLLVVFMVSAPLMTSGVPIDLPDSKAKSITTEDNKPIELTMDKDGNVYLSETQVKRGALITILKATLESSSSSEQPRIYVRADQSLDYGKVMGLLGELNAAGFNKVALITKQK
ncbi:MAG: protein TolR [Alphaproteobacteria bacterium]|nr:protein TolR [Alphaproteobacteria bacterium]